jgi:hypothetical protein
MTLSTRLWLAALILVVDVVAIAVPLAAIAAAYVIVGRPPAFLHWVIRLYGDASTSPRST